MRQEKKTCVRNVFLFLIFSFILFFKFDFYFYFYEFVNEKKETEKQ